MNLLLRHSVVLALVALVAPASSEAAPAPSKVKTQPKATSKARAPERPARRAVIPSFRQIYERDAAELRAQTRALSAALSAARSANTRRESRLEAQVKGLMKRLSKVRAEVTSLESELTREREKGMASDNNLSLVRTAQRVAVSKLRGLGADLAPIGKDEPREKALQRLGDTALHLGQAAMSAQFRTAFAHAAPFQEVMGDVIMAWMLLWRASVAVPPLEKLLAGLEVDARQEKIETHKNAAFYHGQIQSATYFINSLLPVTHGKMDAIMAAEPAVVDMPEAAFGG